MTLRSVTPDDALQDNPTDPFAPRDVTVTVLCPACRVTIDTGDGDPYADSATAAAALAALVAHLDTDCPVEALARRFPAEPDPAG